MYCLFLMFPITNMTHCFVTLGQRNTLSFLGFIKIIWKLIRISKGSGVPKIFGKKMIPEF